MVENNKAESKKILLDTQSDIITDLVVRVTALEQVLIKKNLVLENEYAAELQSIVDKMSGFTKLLIEQNENPSSETFETGQGD
jgi:hypothetical protein